MNGAADNKVLDCAYNEDRILVTANVGDFEKLAQARDLHGGIVLIEDGSLLRDEQEQLVRDAIAAIEAEDAAGRDMVNRVLRTNLAGSKTFETLPPAASS